jgi:hypothetical protein
MELNDAFSALIWRQSLSVHLLKQRFFLGRQIEALAGERSPHAGTATTDFRKLGISETVFFGHLFCSGASIA